MSLENIPILSDLVNTLITYLPRLINALIVSALGLVFGLLVSFIILSVVGKMGLESGFRKTTVGRAILRAGYTPSSFFALIGRGFIYLFTILSALQVLSIQPLTDAVQSFTNYLPNLIGGILILIVGFISADWIAESVEKGTSSKIQASLFGGLIRLLFYFIVITISLTQMRIDVTILYIFSQALAWSLAIAIGVAFGWNLKDRIGLWLEKMNKEEKSEDVLREE